MPKLLGQRRHACIAQRAHHLVAGRQPGAGDAVRDHLGIAQDRRAGGERRAGGGDQAAAERDMPRRLGLPQACIMRTTTSASSSEKRDRSVSARMMANERR